MDLGPPPYAPAPKNIPPNKHFPFVTLFLSLLITALGTSTTVLAYQNIQLKKQIDSISQSIQKPPLSITPSPTPQQITPTQTQILCGGIAGKKCPEGYVCQMTATYPDASGTCTKDGLYTCPKSGYIDCMPSPNAGVRFECTPEAMKWYTSNCPNFKGGAL